MGRALKILAVLALLGAAGLAAAFWQLSVAAHRSADPTDAEIREFTVDKGASLQAIGRSLESAGLIESAFVWQVHNRLEPGPGAKAGRHPLAPSMTMAEIRLAITNNPLPEDEPLTIVEGLRIRDVDAALAEAGRIEPGAYIAATSDLTRYDIPFPIGEPATLEGFLLPETYRVEKGPLDVAALVQRQINALNDRFYEPNKAKIEAGERSFRDLVTMASMLEREEPKPALRPKVAGILWKRLDNDWKLGVDATSRYTLEDWSDRRKFLKKLRDENDPYNSRLRAGLPPTPIGAPSLPSLEAALAPVETPYWYYLHDADKNIRFARDAAEHERNRKKYNVY